jgi:hypothetical protein
MHTGDERIAPLHYQLPVKAAYHDGEPWMKAALTL